MIFISEIKVISSTKKKGAVNCLLLEADQPA